MTRERSSAATPPGLEATSNRLAADGGVVDADGTLRPDRLVMSVAEAATALGVSDDLLYEVVARGELPSLRFGRRRVIPRRAVELLLESAVGGFDPSPALSTLTGRRRTGAGSDAPGRRAPEDHQQDRAGANGSAPVPFYMGASTSSTSSGRSWLR